MSVSAINLADSAGQMRSYQCLDRPADANSDWRITAKDRDGNEAIFTKIQTATGEYKYVLFNGGEEVNPVQQRQDKLNEDKSIFTKNGRSIWNLWNCFGLLDDVSNGWDQTVDSATTAFDQGVLGVDETAATIDGADDGEISGKEKGAYFVKGCADPFVSMAKNPVKTAVAGVAIAAGTKAAVAGLVAAGVACPPAGVILAGVALVAGIGLLAWNGMKALGWFGKAKTDAEARANYRGMGQGAMTAVTAGVALKKQVAMHRATAKVQAQTQATAAYGNARQKAGLTKPEVPTTPPARGGLAGRLDDIKGAYHKGVDSVSQLGQKETYTQAWRKMSISNPKGGETGTKPGFWQRTTGGFGLTYRTNKQGFVDLQNNIQANLNSGHTGVAKAQLAELRLNISAARRSPIEGVDVAEWTEIAQGLEGQLQLLNPTLSGFRTGTLYNGTLGQIGQEDDIQAKIDFSKEFQVHTIV